MAVDVIATIYPASGKVDRVVELLSNHAKWAQANEPKTPRYELKRHYADMEAIKEHGKAPEFLAIGETLKEEGLVSAPM